MHIETGADRCPTGVAVGGPSVNERLLLGGDDDVVGDVTGQIESEKVLRWCCSVH